MSNRWWEALDLRSMLEANILTRTTCLIQVGEEVL